MFARALCVLLLVSAAGWAAGISYTHNQLKSRTPLFYVSSDLPVVVAGFESSAHVEGGSVKVRTLRWRGARACAREAVYTLRVSVYQSAR